MSADVIISVENLGKKYRILHQGGNHRYTALRDVIAEKTNRLVGRLRFGKSKQTTENAAAPNPFLAPKSPASVLASVEDFWALREVSFEVKRGEVVGVIGRNGAGKSTLLKILSRIIEPTAGRVILRGRVASLLEVGTGFHPELTGRENIFLNGAILGLRRTEIKARFDEIVAFAGVEKFLDTPVKRYSSGMYVRLAFAVAAHLESEILIVDEVLAVGDAEFQKKCLGKMSAAARTGRTVLFVSHNMATLQQLCGRAIWLDEGQVRMDSDAKSTISAYLKLGQSEIAQSADVSDRPRATQGLGESARVVSAKSLPEDGIVFAWCEPLKFEIEIMSFKSNMDVIFGVGIAQPEDNRLASIENHSSPMTMASGDIANLQVILTEPRLAPGIYYLIVGVRSGLKDLDYLGNAVRFEVAAFHVSEAGDNYDGRPGFGPICCAAVWKITTSRPSEMISRPIEQARV